ncbi:amino acid ABC transporter substrate-binding protein [Chitinophaga agrisoli]|uniref:Amino acid ABC transporter substrate-binding protein n=1 Tax=Chitinophaga agrisoli TaxID=2607653 RepID=A0A5B2VQC8_9BACT|nr:ABC transporter substrate-binding protein [Chitinophaga agrisoli]KAA2240437.1 amino acid ABC transporter substrate-binding protein [Chitinophaga agrisoli]
MSLPTITRQLLTAAAIAILLSACSLFKKSTSSPELPPPVTSKPATEEKKKDEEKKPDAKAPFNVPAFGREVKRASYNIALFAPLYLDSVFSSSMDIQGRTMPRYVLPGLDFYEGAQLALDTLRMQGLNLNVIVYDSKSRANSVPALVRNRTLDAVDLIIGAVSNPELKELSDFAKSKEVNLVSATYPNDGGINSNPFLLITNSTLKTHCEALQNYVQEAFATKNVVLLRRNTPVETRIANDIKAAYDKQKSERKSRIREVVWSDATTDAELSQSLLTDRPNICIVTALDEAGAKAILTKLSVQAATYPLHIFGMPTWDVMKFKEPELKALQLYYSSPYFNDKTDVYSRYISDYFKRTYKARPSDMAFKGFELTYYFIKLLNDKGVYFNTDVNDPNKKVFTNFNYQPVYLKDGEQTPDYFENKNIYIIQKNDSSDVKMNMTASY